MNDIKFRSEPPPIRSAVRPAALILLVAASLASSQVNAAVRKQADAAAVIRGPVAARIDSTITTLANLGVAGTLLVERDGKVILHKGYGVVNRSTHARATTTTPYLLGSLSKQFTAAAAYRLQSQGKLQLSDSLPHWFDNVPPDKQGITVEQLIHHTSGLPYLGHGDLYDSMSVDSMVRETMAYRLDFQPGTQYEYSSPGYDLLARIVERASGVPFNQYLRRFLFDPAGMSSTGFADEPSRWPPARRTPSYSDAGNQPDPPLYPVALAPKIVGSGSVVSTAGDLWSWEQALRTHRVLDAAATEAYFQPGPVRTPAGGYAGGWQVVKSQRNTNVILHAGDIGGFNTDMRRLVDEHATIIFLSNGREGGRGYREVVPILATRILFGPEPELPRRPVPVASADLAAWRGRVTLRGGAAVDASVRDREIWVTANDQAGMFLISGADSAAQARALAINRIAGAVADSLLRGGAHSLDSTFSPSLVEASHPEFFRIWHSVADSLGGVPQVEVVGTVSPSPAQARTLVRLHGARRNGTMGLDWLGGRLIQSLPADDGLTYRFLPESRSRLSRYDVWTARNIVVERS